ncbi:MFS transporter, partial [Candidatus Woesearchaeota archaeon]|nr:MFS transporter [Candidatus Woesearchaeota archaeon]
MEPDKGKKNVFRLGLASFFTDVSSEMIFPILPLFLTTVLKANMAVVGLVEGIAESSSALLKMLSGTLSDRFGRKKPLVVAGYSLSAVTKPLLALATHWWHVLAVRISDRVGKGLRTAPRDALIAASVEKEKRGRSFGLHRMMDTSGAIVGTLIAFVVLKLMAESASTFKLIFLLSLIPGILALLILVLGVKEVKSAPSGKKLSFNFRALSPQLKKFLLVIAVFNLANFSYAFFLLRANDVGVAIAIIPLIYLVYNVFYAGFSIPAGRLSDRIGRKAVLGSGIILFGITSLGFGLIATSITIWVLFALYGLFMAITDGVSRAYVSDLSSSDKAGFALGTYHTIIGITVFPANFIGGLLWENINVAAP